MPPKTVVTLDPDVNIDPIPTGAGGIVRGTTIVVKGTATCVKDTSDGNPQHDVTENVPEAITEVAVRFGQSGTFETATPTGPPGPNGQKSWSTWTTGPHLISGVVSDTLEITARVSAGKGALAGEAVERKGRSQ
jgi:hypothetical protein